MTGQRAARNAGLDGFRAVASLMVVVFHVQTVGGVGFGPLDPLVFGGRAGVWIFFALSGYLLFRPFLTGPVDIRSYALKRGARILPGYYVALGCLVLLTGNRIPIEHPLPFLSMTASYSIPLRGFMGVAWTLSAELVFYAALPLIALVARRRELVVLGTLGAASLLLAMSHPVDVNDPALWLTGTFPFVFYAFVPGMLLAVLEVRSPALFRRLAATRYLAIGIAYLVAGTLTQPYPGVIVIGIGAPMVMAWLLQHRAPWTRALAFAGGASYALYLWHWDLLNAFGVLGLPIALIGSGLSWAIVERPILDLAHRFTAAWRIPKPVEVAAS